MSQEQLIVYNINDVNFDKIDIGHMKKGKINFAKIFYNKDVFLFHLPELNMPFGMSKDLYGRTTVDFTLTKSRRDQSILEKFNRLDEFIMKFAYENSKSWFGEDITYERIVEAYKKSYNTVQSWDPTFRAKLDIGFNNEIKSQFNYIDGEEIEHNNDVSFLLSLVKRKSVASSVIHCSGVYIIPGQNNKFKFGLTFKLVELNLKQELDTVVEEESEDEYDFDSSEGSADETDVLE